MASRNISKKLNTKAKTESRAQGTSNEKMDLSSDRNYILKRYISFMDTYSSFFSLQETAELVKFFKELEKEAGNPSSQHVDVEDSSKVLEKNMTDCKCLEKIEISHKSDSTYGKRYKNTEICGTVFVNDSPYLVCYPPREYFHDQCFENGKSETECNKIGADVDGKLNFNRSKSEFVAPIFGNSTITSNNCNVRFSRYGVDIKLTKNISIDNPLLNYPSFDLRFFNPQYQHFYEYYVNNGCKDTCRSSMMTHLKLITWDTEYQYDVNKCPFNAKETENKEFNNSNNNLLYSIEQYNRENSKYVCFHDMKFNNNVLNRKYIFEHVDFGAMIYRLKFNNRMHVNYLIQDETYGPIVLSMIKYFGEYDGGVNELQTQKLKLTLMNDSMKQNTSLQKNYVTEIRDQSSTNREKSKYSFFVKYSIIIRSVQLQNCRINMTQAFKKKNDYVKINSNNSQKEKKFIDLYNSNLKYIDGDILKYLLPKVDLTNLKTVKNCKKLDEDILSFDESCFRTCFKVGVLYCGPNQSTEEEIYNNEHGSKNFEDFLLLLGEKVRLKGFGKCMPVKPYLGQMDIENDRTGTHAIYTKFSNRQIMFHVSTYLPFQKNNVQQIERKRQIGNDIVTVVFMESDSSIISPEVFQSHYQHVFIFVRLLKNGKYFVTCSRRIDVPYFGPLINQEEFSYDNNLKEFLLTKIINGENAAHHSTKFKKLNLKARYQWLKDIVSQEYNTVNSHKDSFLKVISGVKKPKEFQNSVFISPELFSFYGVRWYVETVTHREIRCRNCLFIISNELITFVDIEKKEIFLTIQIKKIILWKTTHNQKIDIYYKPNCLITLSMPKGLESEMPFIICRLKFLMEPKQTRIITLRKFDGGPRIAVNNYGVVTYVDKKTEAYEKGISEGTQILEINKIPIVKLSYKRFLQLLKMKLKEEYIYLTVVYETTLFFKTIKSKVNRIRSYSLDSCNIKQLKNHVENNMENLLEYNNTDMNQNEIKIKRELDIDNIFMVLTESLKNTEDNIEDYFPLDNNSRVRNSHYGADFNKKYLCFIPSRGNSLSMETDDFLTDMKHLSMLTKSLCEMKSGFKGIEGEVYNIDDSKITPAIPNRKESLYIPPARKSQL